MNRSRSKTGTSRDGESGDGAGTASGLWGGGDSYRPLSVGAVSGLIRTALAENLPTRLRVVGEVSNFSNRTHWFFSLKDEQATLSCVCFASAAREVDFPMANGLAVVATGRIDYYDAQGRLQLYVDALEPVGQGALELRLRALCEELRKQGYFDPARKKALPVMPRRVAVVTSRNAAALQDVINTTGQRWAGCQLLLYDVRVQGEGAGSEIANAVRALSQDGQRLGIDAIILTRGGGSIEDLWAFNERVVADAVHECAIPIVAAIGHETDTTVAELVADVRCATPTQAVMTLIPDQAALEHQLQQLSYRLTLVLKRQYQLGYERYRAVCRHPIIRRPQSLVEQSAQRLEDASDRLDRAMQQRVRSNEDRLAALGRHLESVSPKSVLTRGYSYTLGPGGGVVRSVVSVKRGDRITTVLADGRFDSTVDGDGRDQPAQTKPTRVSRKQGRRVKENDQPALFD